MKRRKRGIYTPMGKRIRELGTQVEIAKVLGLTQQSVSGKMTGSIAISLNDLENLCYSYGKGMRYFFDREAW